VCQLRETPDNTAVLDGQQVLLRCRSKRHNIIWTRQLVDGTSDTVADRCKVLPKFASDYSVISDRSRDRCNLVINRTSTSLTGLYSCHEDTRRPDTASANVIIIGQLFSMLLRRTDINLIFTSLLHCHSNFYSILMKLLKSKDIVIFIRSQNSKSDDFPHFTNCLPVLKVQTPH